MASKNCPVRFFELQTKHKNATKHHKSISFEIRRLEEELKEKKMAQEVYSTTISDLQSKMSEFTDPNISEKVAVVEKRFADSVQKYREKVPEAYAAAKSATKQYKNYINQEFDVIDSEGVLRVRDPVKESNLKKEMAEAKAYALKLKNDGEHQFF
jgi:hypothetical protein